MPGAKRGNFFNDVFRRLSLENFLGFDITEIQGADNLHKPALVDIDCDNTVRLFASGQNGEYGRSASHVEYLLEIGRAHV